MRVLTVPLGTFCVCGHNVGIHAAGTDEKPQSECLAGALELPKCRCDDFYAAPDQEAARLLGAKKAAAYAAMLTVGPP